MADITPPSTPSALTATVASSTSVQLQWAASTDNVAVTGYRVYRNGSQVATATTNPFTVTGLSPATSYTFHVAAVDAAGNQSGSSASATTTTPGTQAIVDYDFPRGDTLAAKNGWAFASTSWSLTPTADGSGLALPFTYAGVVPGNYGMSEMRFTMPPQDEFWLRVRWHIPANYGHRHDTELQIANATTAGWRVGDKVRGTDGVSEGVISQIGASNVFLRFAAKSAYNAVWAGTLTNTTRNSALTSTGRSQWAANNKLLAIWTDGYSSTGLGSTIVWQTDSDWYFSGGTHSIVTVGYTRGGNTVTGSVANGGALITPADYGKYMDIIFHGKFSTTPGAKNGVIRTFARKQGEAAYTMRHNITNADMDKRSDVAANLRQWRAGYLMGWANSGFDAATTFHISKIQVFGQQPADLMGVSP
ncbi:fibronectin type III domain-containing protein [Acidovorax radicis]|uniref:fibronectin type III domain-containing protein n=1 Tax=Acidovorax radicis TaxID=758826 RepID=UPI000237835B|nr:fibronectin type III domain-containing protein [Acidovorax radicis]